MKDIDKGLLVDQIKQMINVLEYDSSRSAGKAKLNSQHLHSMYWLLHNVYEKPVVKTANKKDK